MSLDNRQADFPHLIKDGEVESSSSNIPRPAQVTGTLSVKLVGVEGLVDIATIRVESEGDSLNQQRASSTNLFTHIMTLPRSRATSSPHISFDREKSDTDGNGQSYNSNTLAWHRPRGGSKHANRSKAHLEKQHSGNQDLLEESLGEDTTVME